MPSPQRQSHRFHCRGVNLGASIDELGPGEYPSMLNVRALQQGGVTARPGQTVNLPLLNPVHSIRTLNNVATTNTKNVIGSGTNLYLDSMFVETGFSGDPLSFVRFRPDQSTESWMYIADKNKLRKVNTEGVIRNMGIAPPAGPPVTEIGSSLYKTISEFETASGWSAGTSIARDPGGVTITAILYDTPSTPGFCCIVPSGTDFSWLQPGMRITFPSTAEVVTVLEVHNAIANSTVASFLVDNLSTTPGIATICLTTPTQGLDHNSIVRLSNGVQSEYVRVISATTGPDGLYSFRCRVNNIYLPGSVVTGQVALRCYVSTIFAPGASITSTALQFTATTGTTLISKVIALDMSQIVSRPVGPNDYMHISVKLDVPGNLSYGRVLLDVDQSVNTFSRNFYQKEFRASDLESATNGVSSTLTASLNAINNTQIEQSATDYVTGDIYTAPDFGPGTNQSNNTGLPDSLQLSTGNDQWTELTFNVSDLQRVGTDTTRSLKNIAVIGIQLVVTASTVCTVSSWCVGGTYGPDVTPGQPIGIIYRYRYRDSTTGAKSIPSPAVRYDVFPLRQWVSVGCLVCPDPACDTIDIERLDPALQASGSGPQWRFTGSIPNAVNIGGLAVYDDFNTPEYVSATQPLEINVIQPFVTLLPPINTTAQVSGTAVVVNQLLPNNILQDTVILIGGTAYQIYATPKPIGGTANTFLELTSGAGVFGNLSVQIASPATFGTALPFMFGPLEGPTASFVFGLGDRNNPGLLYWLNGNDPDSMDSKNYIEVTPPSEPLVSGCVWNTYVFVASRDRVFLIQPTFDQPNLFTPVQVRSNSGVQGRWLMAAGADGVYLGGRDGIYKATPYAGADCISHELWPLFPHEGQPGAVTNGYQPIHFIAMDQLRIADGDIHVLTGGMDWRYGLVWSDKDFQPPIDRGWFPEQYPLPPLTVYQQELPPGVNNLNIPNPLLLQGVSTGVQQLGAVTDNIAPVTASITIPPLKPGQDTRGNNLYVDCITDLQGTAQITLLGNLNIVTVQGASTITQAVRGLAITVIDQTGNLALYRDVSAQYSFSAGTVLYEYQPQFFPQPVTMTNYTQQNTDHGIPGWKLTRWLRMGVICSGATTLTVTTSEGQTFTYTLQATGALSGLTTQDMNVVFLMKARMFGYDLSGPAFVMFPNSCYIRMKKFGSNGAFQEVPIFAVNP